MNRKTQKLLAAVSERDLVEARKALSSNWPFSRAKVDARDEYGDTPLITAVTCNWPEFVEILIDHGADVNAKNDGSEPALFLAAKRGCTQIARMLIEHGAAVNCSNKDYVTAAEIAAKEGHIELVKLLLDNGARQNIKLALNEVIDQGHMEFVEQLIDGHININDIVRKQIKQRLGFLFFVRAVESDDLQQVESFLNKGDPINLEEEDADGRTPLMRAAASGNVTIIKLLVENGAKIGTRNNVGFTAFSCAASAGQIDSLKWFLDNGVSIHDSDYLMDAALGDHFEVTEFLIRRGAAVNAVNEYGETPLMGAVRRGNFNIAKLLLNNGAAAKIDQQNRYDGRSALDEANRRGNRDMIILLRKHGAVES